MGNLYPDWGVSYMGICICQRSSNCKTIYNVKTLRSENVTVKIIPQKTEIKQLNGLNYVCICWHNHTYRSIPSDFKTQ